MRVSCVSSLGPSWGAGVSALTRLARGICPVGCAAFRGTTGAGGIARAGCLPYGSKTGVGRPCVTCARLSRGCATRVCGISPSSTSPYEERPTCRGRLIAIVAATTFGYAVRFRGASASGDGYALRGMPASGRSRSPPVAVCPIVNGSCHGVTRGVSSALRGAGITG